MIFAAEDWKSAIITAVFILIVLTTCELVRAIRLRAQGSPMRAQLDALADAWRDEGSELP